MPRPCAHSIRRGNSSSLTPLSATVLILIFSPAACAASMPAKTWSNEPQRVMARNFSGSSVSSETLRRLNARRRKRIGIFGKLRAVGGQGQLVESAGAQMPRQRVDERHDAAPHQRLAAGEPELADAARHKSRTQTVEFLQRKNFSLRQKRHVFRHAIDAAEVTPVGHRNAQIGNGAAERIDQFPPSCDAEFHAWQAR